MTHDGVSECTADLHAVSRDRKLQHHCFSRKGYCGVVGGDLGHAVDHTDVVTDELLSRSRYSAGVQNGRGVAGDRVSKYLDGAVCCGADQERYTRGVRGIVSGVADRVAGEYQLGATSSGDGSYLH